MALSKRLRYEILRRDNHTCRYCGASAPDVKLTVDHVVPVALGGSDDASNLVAACADCNAGKSSSSPDAPIVAQVSDRALEWANAMEEAAEERAAYYARSAAVVAEFREIWDRWIWTDWQKNERQYEVPAAFGASIQEFIAAGLTMEDLDELVRIAMSSTASEKWLYFCGCCWRRIREAQQRASQILADREEAQREVAARSSFLDDLFTPRGDQRGA